MRALRAATSTASSLTVDSSCPVPPSRSEWAGSAAIVPGPLVGRMHPPADRQRVADGLAGVDVQAGRRRGWAGGAPRAAVRRRPSRRRARRPTPAARAPRRAPARPGRPTSPAAGGRGSPWCCRRRRRWRRRPTAGGAGASGSGSGGRCPPAASAAACAPRGVGVSTTSRVRPNRSVATMLVVRAPMWMPSVRNGSWLTSTGTRGRPIAPETARSARSRSTPASSRAVTWRFTVAMLRPGDLRDDVAGDRAAQPGGAEHRCRGGVGDAQRGRDDVVAGLRVAPAAVAAGAGGCDAERDAEAVLGRKSVRTGVSSGKSVGGSGPHLATQQDGISPGSVRRGGVRNNNTHAARQRGLPDHSGTRGQLSTAMAPARRLKAALTVVTMTTPSMRAGSRWSPAPAPGSARRPREPLPHMAFTWSAWPGARTRSPRWPPRSAARRLWRTSPTPTAVAALAGRLDRVDVLVNNAGGAAGWNRWPRPTSSTGGGCGRPTCWARCTSPARCCPS